MKAKVITSSEELSDYVDRWEDIRKATGGTAYSKLDLIKVWLETFKDSSSPRIIVVEDGGHIVGIAPLVASTYNVKGLSFKTLSLAGQVPHCFDLFSNSVMLLPDYKATLELMLGEIKHLSWSFLRTNYMVSNNSVQHYMNAVQSNWYSIVQPPHVDLILNLKESGDIIDGFSRNGRGNLRKTLRAIDREGLLVKLRRLQSEEIDRAVDVYVQQHVRRWQSKGGSMFLDPRYGVYMKRTFKRAYGAGYGSIHELTFDGQVAGQAFCFQDGDEMYGFRVGMNDEFSDYSPGWLVCYFAFQKFRDGGVKRCFLGTGDEKYKYSMGAVESPLVGITASRGIASMAYRIKRSRPVRSITSMIVTSKDLPDASPSGQER